MTQLRNRIKKSRSYSNDFFGDNEVVSNSRIMKTMTGIFSFVIYISTNCTKYLTIAIKWDE